MAVRALLLDADGVIQRPAVGWTDAWRALLPDPRAPETQFRAFLHDVFVAERPALAGNGDIEEALAGVLAKWNSPAPARQGLDAWTLIDVDLGVLAFVAALRNAGLPVHLATNQQAHRAAYMSETLGYGQCFDREYYSCRVGAAKPSAAYFQHILDDLACEPASVLFIDDVEANVEAARQLGLCAVQHHMDAGVGAFERVLVRHGVAIPGSSPR